MTNVLRLFADEPAASPAPVGDFEAVWRYWPNKANKMLAKAKYQSILKGKFNTRMLDKDSGLYVEIELTADHATILKGVKAYLDSQIDKRTYRLKDDGKYIPHLATFLNRGRFFDLLDEEPR